MRAAWMADWPMPPAPMTTTVWPGPDPGPVEHRAGAGDHRAADEAGGAERHLGVDDHGLGLGDHHLLGEHAGVGEAERLLAAHGERPAEAAHRVAAVGGLAPVAGRAAPAVAERGEHDVVADLHLGDRVAHLLDDARALVAEHDRRGERDRAVDHRHVAVAQPGVGDADPHLVPGRGVARTATSSRTSSCPVQTMPSHGSLDRLAPLSPATRSTGARCRRGGRSCPGRARRPRA